VAGTGKTETAKTETDETDPTQVDPETGKEADTGQPPAVLGSVLGSVRLDDDSLRVARLKIDLRDSWLVSGGTLFIDLPRRLSCAACEGGGCSRCKNAGGYRLSNEAERTPLRLEIQRTEREAMRIRVPLAGNDDVDVVLVEIARGEPPSAFVRYEGRRAQIVRTAPASSITPVGIISTVIGLVALILTIILALVMRS
jgi:hypothetical protein